MEIATEINIQNKKALKKQFNRVGGNLLIREAFLIAGGVVMGFAAVIYLIIKNRGIDTLDFDTFANQIMTNPIMSIIPVLMGFLPVLYFMKRSIPKERVLYENKKFNIKTVMVWFVILLGVNCAGGLVSVLMESILNNFGFTLEKSEKILETLNAPYMILYVVIVAPIVEELIYRGMVLRFLDKFDKGAAIVGSAVLFGFMHANFSQIFFAAGVGILLGYITEEYSIKLAIILHMINNIFSFFIANSTGYLSAYNISEEIIDGCIVIVCIAVLIIAVIRNIKKIKEAFIQYKPEKYMCKYFFTSFSVIVLLAYYLFEACSQISRV